MVRMVRVVWAVALAVMLAGCSGVPVEPEPTSEATEPTPAPEATAEPRETLPPGTTSIVLWEPFPLDRPEGITLSEIVRDFEAANPDVLVEVQAKDGTIGLNDAMLAALPNGELPDLGVAFPGMIAGYAAQGAVVPLDGLVSDPMVGLTPEEMDDLFPGMLSAGRLPGYGGQLMAFPFAQNAVGMWVNRTLLAQAGWDEPPVTWDEFEQACYDVWATLGVACYPFVESVTTFDAWLYSRGGLQVDPAGERAAFNGPAGVDSLTLLRRMMDAGLAWRPAEAYGDYLAFARGQAAFTFSSTGLGWLYAEAYEAALHNEGVAPFDWEQRLIPQVDPGQPATALYGTSWFVVRSDPFRERAAWRLIRWFSTREQTARWAAQLQALPVRVSALEVMTDTLEAYPFVRAQVEEILPYAQPEPAVEEEFEVRDILYTAILSVTQGYSETQEALDRAAQEVDAVLGGR